MDLATEPGLTAALRARGYQVRGPAGVGAGGTAWAASAPDGRRVVVGVLDLDLTLAERRAALARIEKLRDVDHPHLASLVDVVALDGHRTALVAEAVDGPTVGAVLEARPQWAVGEVVTLVVPLAGALAALHTQGLVHGDVAPENVVLAPGGRPVLVDLAAIVLPGAGTRGFAPRDRAGTPAADVYALARLGLTALGSAGSGGVDQGGADDGGRSGDRSLASDVETTAARALRVALDAACGAVADGRPSPEELASACFEAASPVPVEVPEAAVLTRLALTRLTDAPLVDRTMPDPRVQRRRRITGLVAGAVGAAALAVGLVLVLPPGPEGDGAGPVAAPGASRAESGAPATAVPGGHVVAAAVALTERRAEVLASGDRARLGEVTVAGSPAFVADEALLTRLAGHEGELEVSAAVLDARWLGARDGRDLVVVTAEHRVGGAAEAPAPRSVVLALVETAQGWRVAEVLEPGTVDAASEETGPLAG